MAHSEFVRVRALGARRIVRAATALVGVTVITSCSRVEAASVSTRTMAAAEPPASFESPPGTYDAVMAQRGKVHFNDSCAQCHVKPKRATPRPAHRFVRLRYLGRDTAFFADGSVKTLDAVVEHYDDALQLRLSKAQQRDLVEYLKSH